MLLSEMTSVVPKIGEIVVVGSSNSSHWSFLRTVCDQCEITNQNVVLGQIKINEELFLYLYGMNANNGVVQNFAWDLLSQKMLGYVALFDWYDYVSFPKTLQILDYLSQRIEAPLVVAADVKDNTFPISEKIFARGIPISSNSLFTFCRSVDAQSAKTVLRILIDIIIERIV